MSGKKNKFSYLLNICIFIIMILTLQCQNQNKKENHNSQQTMEQVIKIDVNIPVQPCSLAGPCPVKVRITNKSPDPVLLNKRLAVGYRESDSRELYLDIIDKNTNETSTKPAQLYERQFSAPGDYQWIDPEKSIETSFNLFEWYMINKPGEYAITLYYQADEKMAIKPDGLLEGVFSSKPVELKIVP